MWAWTALASCRVTAGNRGVAPRAALTWLKALCSLLILLLGQGVWLVPRETVLQVEPLGILDGRLGALGIELSALTSRRSSSVTPIG